MRWVCLDPGEKRTGVALSSPEETFATPLTVLEHGPAGPSMEQLDVLLDEYWIDAILIGVPVSMDDTLSTQSRAAIDLAVRIAAHLATRVVIPGELEALRDALPSDTGAVRSAQNAGEVPVVLWDERLSTWRARKALYDTREGTRRRGVRPKRLDAHAAAVILQSYFDSMTQHRATDTQSTPERDG